MHPHIHCTLSLFLSIECSESLYHRLPPRMSRKCTCGVDDCIQRVEQMLKQLRVSEGIDVWDGFDSTPVTPLSPKFRMIDMERYTNRGCPRTHLRIYS